MSYVVSPDLYDEAFYGDGTPRPGYAGLIKELAGTSRQARDAVQGRLEEEGVEFGSPDSRSTFTVDPVPRLFSADEWSVIEAGLIQRMAALRHFITDSYGPRTAVDAGVLPNRVLEESLYFEPIAAEIGIDLPDAWVAGPDIVRDRDGRLLVLEDNMRSPSGLSYVVAGSRAVRAGRSSDLPVRKIDGALDCLRDTLRCADPSGSCDPRIAVLSDGVPSSAWYEHREVARRLQAPLVTPESLFSESGELFVQVGSRRLQIDVLYNRSSQESLRDEGGSLTDMGTVLAEPLRRGTVGCVNFFGMGIADDKAVFPYVEGLIHYYLGEVPILDSVTTYDLGDPDVFRAQIDRLAELVIKPRWSFGGHGVVLGPEATAAQIRETEAAVRSAPNRFVAQELVDISVHPTVAGDHLEPRHVDFRPFILNRGGRFTVVPGGLTRFAGARGDRIVNSTQGGGAKDTWVLN